MRYLYSILIRLSWFFLWLTQFFSKKMALFVQGRRHAFSILEKSVSKLDKTIWFHCASLGEYEQGVPVMEELKKQYPNYKLLVTFFSPSGYEVKKNTALADVVIYLPWDTKKNVSKFLSLANPSLAVFVKYEIWPNYLFGLQEKNIPTLLIAALFRENQIYFKPYGRLMRRALSCFNYIFVQDAHAKKLLKSISITKNVTISGDTRFDRVFSQLKKDNTLPFINDFVESNLCLVCGSTWPEDETVLLDFINSEKRCKIIIAPHQIAALKIKDLQKNITKKTVLFSEMNGKNLADFDVFIIDTVGLLTKIYSYADIAYVGGAMGKTGLHNVLEPAVFGIPIIIGKNYNDFPEAIQLIEVGALFSVSDSVSCSHILNILIEDTEKRKTAGKNAFEFIKSHTGATQLILEQIRTLGL
jgi:3-deoxy-D-manno-octulosonic-acid transferase